MLNKIKSKIKYIYEEKYKWLMIIPALLVILALVQILTQYSTTGEFVHKGITLKGGSTIALNFNPGISATELETFLQSRFPTLDMSVRTMSTTGKVIGLAIDSAAQQNSEIENILSALKEKMTLTPNDYNVEIVGSALGENFFKQTILAVLVSFLFMSIVVIIYFRYLIPSLAVILSAFSDIVVTMAIFNLTGMKLSTAGVAAFLMLIGYSVDTDVLLTARLLKRKEGTELHRIYGSISTGMTMVAATTFAVLMAMLFVQSEIIKQIMMIIFIGSLVDIIMTWIQNVGMLRLYLEYRHKKGHVN
ncbi:hypothetical protein J4444_02955 [Candidatus Woesearchaeota archaeon]|nr:hypothetical protein [Candidatus Woesearchaeota archaeon]